MVPSAAQPPQQSFSLPTLLFFVGRSASLTSLTNPSLPQSATLSVSLLACRFSCFFFNAYLQPHWQLVCPLLLSQVTSPLSPNLLVFLLPSYELVRSLQLPCSTSLPELAPVFPSTAEPISLSEPESVFQHELIAASQPVSFWELVFCFTAYAFICPSSLNLSPVSQSHFSQ